MSWKSRYPLETGKACTDLIDFVRRSKVHGQFETEYHKRVYRYSQTVQLKSAIERPGVGKFSQHVI